MSVDIVLELLERLELSARQKAFWLQQFPATLIAPRIGPAVGSRGIVVEKKVE
jgi:hypothetical protein